MKNINHSCISTNAKLFECSNCGLHYKEKEWAKRCKIWCKEHKSCNLEIISHALESINNAVENNK